MKQQLKFFLLVVITAICFQTSAQQQKIIAMSVVSNTPAGDTTNYGVPILDSTTVYTAVMHVTFDNTDSIYQVHVKLGSTLHGSQHLSTAFDYGISGTFGTTSYTQSGNSITLGLGAFTGLRTYFAEVQIEKTDHSFEEAILFSNN